MDMGSYNGLMARGMKETSRMTNGMGKAFLFGKMAERMKDTGKTVNSMVKEFINYLMELK